MDELFRRLGKRIREIRTQNGFNSQEDFADYLKVHRTFVGHLETGRKDFRLTTLIRIAEALGVPLSDLFSGLEADRPARRTASHAHNKQQYAALVTELAALERSVQKLKTIAAEMSANSRGKG